MTRFSNVLLVDDDTTTNYLNQLLFKSLNLADEVLVALNGQEALDLLRTHCPPATAVGPVLVALHVAGCGGAVGKVPLPTLPVSWQARLAQPTARDVYSDVLPGVLQRYDVPDLARALGRRLVVAGR